MASWKMLDVMNTSLIKKWVYFVYYGLQVFVYIYGGSKQRISTMAEGRM